MKKLIVLAFVFSLPVLAAETSGKASWSADRIQFNKKKNIVNLAGNANLKQEDKTLKGDRISFDLKTGNVSCEGKCELTGSKVAVQFNPAN